MVKSYSHIFSDKNWRQLWESWVRFEDLFYYYEEFSALMLLKQDATIFSYGCTCLAIIWIKLLAKILTKAFFSTASWSHSHPLVSAPGNGASGPLYKDSSAMVSWCVTWRLRAPVQSKTYCLVRQLKEISHSAKTNSKRFTPQIQGRNALYRESEFIFQLEFSRDQTLRS